jgi:DNA-directed RNA polymerase specialized sigma24 family protein
LPCQLVEQNPVDRYTARRWLARALQATTPHEQALVVLHELEGWSIEELAQVYRKSAGAIKAQLFRARRKMKKCLDQYLAAADSRRDLMDTSERDITCVAARSGEN